MPTWNGARRVLVVFLAFAVLWTGSVVPAQGLSLSEEKILGRKLLDAIRQYYRLIDDGEIVSYVRSVGRRITDQLQPSPFDYHFYVLDESTPNAFAIPGGYVFVFRGLMEMMESEGELAAILSHELAHVQARHIHERMERGKVLSVATLAGALAAAFLGAHSDVASALATGVMAGSTSLELKYTRENEEEADRLGFRYLCAAGYPPQAMVSVMEKLGREGWRGDSRIPSYLQTHPAVNERVDYLRQMAERMVETSPPRPTRDPNGDFALVQAAIISAYGDPQVAGDQLAAWRMKAGTERRAASHYGMGRLHLRMGRLEPALAELRQAAALKPQSPLVLSSLGEAYYRTGRLTEAENALLGALALDPESAIAHFRLALVLEEQGKIQQALDHLREADTLAPLYPEIDYHLGVLFGRIDQLGPAHFHLGRYYMARSDRHLALFHYEKAKELLPAGDERLEDIEEILETLKGGKKSPQTASFEERSGSFFGYPRPLGPPVRFQRR
jgi:predicted Zn-dependent protease